MDDDLGARDKPAHRGLIADVSTQLIDGALELGVVERKEIECPHPFAVGEQPPRKVQA
jgi:hypothetical protein